MRIYLAASLFTHMEARWNRDLGNAIQAALPGSEVVLPQDFDIPGRHGDAKRYGKIFAKCAGAVDDSDVVVALLEGAEVDSGTAWEVGYAYAKGKPVIGLRTDFRPGADNGLNIMLSRSCRFLIRDVSFTEDVRAIAKKVVTRLKKIQAERKKA